MKDKYTTNNGHYRWRKRCVDVIQETIISNRKRSYDFDTLMSACPWVRGYGYRVYCKLAAQAINEQQKLYVHNREMAKCS